MHKIRVVGLSERAGRLAESSVGLEVDRKAATVTVGEVFEALQVYLDRQKAELRRRGPASVRVSLVRRSGAAEGAVWAASLG